MESSDALCDEKQVSTNTQTQCSQADAQEDWSTRRKGRRLPCVLASLKPTKIHLCGLGGLGLRNLPGNEIYLGLQSKGRSLLGSVPG